MKEHQILLVDDEKQILNSLKRLLRREEYKIFAVCSGVEALQILKENDISLIISDYRMPNMNGIKFLQEAKKVNKNAIRVILSGFADEDAILNAINKGEIYRFFAKPWNDEELKIAIRQCLEQYKLKNKNIELMDIIEKKNKELQHMNINLEQIVESRTNDILLLQDMFHHLPIPVIGISNENIVVLYNEIVITNFNTVFENLMMGESIKEIFTENIFNDIVQCLDNNVSRKVGNLNCNKKEFSLFFNPISEANKVIGGLVIIEEDVYEN